MIPGERKQSNNEEVRNSRRVKGYDGRNSQSVKASGKRKR
jgi:hypothetical protein